jgi:hypothetical protein
MRSFMVDYKTNIIIPGVPGTNDLYPEQIEYRRLVEDPSGKATEEEVSAYIAKELHNFTWLKSNNGVWFRTSTIVSYTFNEIKESDQS